jgi:hypothetical protein
MRTNLTRILAMAGLVAVLALAAQANPPSDIKLVFDKQMKMLTVTVLHNITRFPQGHYIKEIDVTVNGKPMVMQYFASQTDKTQQQAMYTLIDAKAGSTISVKAICSLKGDMTKTLKVP